MLSFHVGIIGEFIDIHFAMLPYFIYFVRAVSCAFWTQVCYLTSQTYCMFHIFDVYLAGVRYLWFLMQMCSPVMGHGFSRFVCRVHSCRHLCCRSGFSVYVSSHVALWVHLSCIVCDFSGFDFLLHEWIAGLTWLLQCISMLLWWFHVWWFSFDSCTCHRKECTRSGYDLAIPVPVVYVCSSKICEFREIWKKKKIVGEEGICRV